jgi:hypothetical protein
MMDYITASMHVRYEATSGPVDYTVHLKDGDVKIAYGPDNIVKCPALDIRVAAALMRESVKKFRLAK